MRIVSNEDAQILEAYKQELLRRQQQPIHFAGMLPTTLPPPAKKKKKKAAQKKVNPNPLSSEAKMWIAILILSFFSILIVKDWLTTTISTPIQTRDKTK